MATPGRFESVHPVHFYRDGLTPPPPNTETRHADAQGHADMLRQNEGP